MTDLSKNSIRWFSYGPGLCRSSAIFEILAIFRVKQSEIIFFHRRFIDHRCLYCLFDFRTDHSFPAFL